jgi:asparagine synthase (glutamine-hydrolysing)
MCGIAGIVGSSTRVSHPLAPMLHALERRGPDSEGLTEWPGAVLGHRRLAIFDLSEAGHQPMLSPDGALGVVFNGAIYNFRELRRELESAGVTFASETDTEVLLHGYRVWGVDRLVERLRGMFAFALWDDRAQRLFLVRDRLGVKPLIYTRRNGELAFASTVRALRAAGLAGGIDATAVVEFLQLGFVTERRSIYESVEKLPPASIAEWSASDFSVRRYWTPPAHADDRSVSFEEAIEETERLLLEAVELRLHADVPVASLLSGGIDSSLVCWAIAKLGGDVTAYTAGTPGHAVDETDDAVATARAIGIRHNVLPLSDADDAGVGELVVAFAEPFACSSALGMLRIARAIADTPARVVLSGDGGDDVFLGYPRHRLLLRTQGVAQRLPGMATPSWAAVRRLIPQRGALKRFTHLLDYTTGGLGAFVRANPGFTDFRAHGLLGERLKGADFDFGAVTWSLDSARDSLAEYLAYDRDMQFVSEYLVKVDGSTMHYGLEARAPFLDHVLWEHTAALPHGVRLHGGHLKAILREIARRRIGERVARGSKRGFSIPVESWMARRWHGRVTEAFQDSVLVADGWIGSEPLQRELATAARRGVASRRLWYLWVLEEWMRAERELSAASDARAPTPRPDFAAIPVASARGRG